ncbi:MAG: type I DNA topoisomerase [Planctomycetota bacterium]|nr:type I DNA topoisomerase [Planctomycetota bacterium]
MKLVIVESPAKAKTINKILGRGYVVKASMGHVRDLPEKEFAVDIEHGFTPRYEVIESRKKVVGELRKTARNAEAVYLAPDPDREGEAIAWHLVEALKIPDDRALRVTMNEITPRAVRRAFESPGAINANLVNAQQARRILDRIVGYKLSRLLWDKILRGLSAGRVQSVALRLVVEREREIAAFKPEEYWTCEGVFERGGSEFAAQLKAVDGVQVVTCAEELARLRAAEADASQKPAPEKLPLLLRTREEAESLIRRVAGKPFRVARIESREVKDHPYPPFATSQLQQAAANRLGFSAKRTMQIAQALYEGVNLGPEGPVGLITYMRTDSFRVAQEAMEAAREFIGKSYGPAYVPEKPNIYRSRKGAQDAHEAIRPTDVTRTPDSIRTFLSDEQYRLYRLIWERFVASQCTPAVFTATTCDLEAEGCLFRATGRSMLFDGYLRVAGRAELHLDRASQADLERGDEADPAAENGEPGESGERAAGAKQDGGTPAPDAAPGVTAPEGTGGPRTKRRGEGQELPPLVEGDEVRAVSISPEQHLTQPPPRYTEASLVKALERAGIGRPSTYATILSTIQERGYVEKRKRSLYATPLGTMVSDRLTAHFPSIMDVGFTRDMEEDLDEIEEGRADWVKILEDFYGKFSAEMTKAEREMPSAKGRGEKTDIVCDVCGAFMERRVGRYGPFLRCSNHPRCPGRKQMDANGMPIERREKQPELVDVNCELCGAKMARKVSRFGPFLGCSRYPECRFTMRLDRNGNPVRREKPIETDVPCPKCGSPMAIRRARRGRNRAPFLGCSRYPRCRGTAELTGEIRSRYADRLAEWAAAKAGGNAGKGAEPGQQGPQEQTPQT